DARLSRRALAVVAAGRRLGRRLAATGVAFLAAATVTVAAALLALAVHAVFLFVAVLVLAALGILGRAAGCERQHQQRRWRQKTRPIHARKLFPWARRVNVPHLLERDGRVG